MQNNQKISFIPFIQESKPTKPNKHSLFYLKGKNSEEFRRNHGMKQVSKVFLEKQM